MTERTESPDSIPTVRCPSPNHGTKETFVKRSLSGAFQLSLAMAITLPLGLVTKVLLPRFLGSEKAGQFFFAESFPLLLLAFAPFGLPSYLQKVIPSDPSRARHVFASVSGVFFLLCGLLSAALLSYMSFAEFEPMIFRLTAIMCIFQALQLYQTEILQSFHAALGRVSTVAWNGVLNKVGLVLATSLVLFGDLNLEDLAWGFVIVSLFPLCFLFRSASRSGFLSFNLLPVSEVLSLLFLCLPFLLGEVIGRLSGSIDTALLTHLASYDEVGYYGSYVRLHGLFLLAVPVLYKVVLPVMSQSYGKHTSEYLPFARGVLKAILLLSFPLALAMILFAAELVPLIFGNDFIPATASLRTYGLLLLTSYAVIFACLHGVVTSNGRKMATILLLGTLLNIGLTYAAIPVMLGLLGEGGAAVGAALATGVSELFVAGTLLYILPLKLINTRLAFLYISVLAAAVTLLLTVNLWSQVGLLERVLAFVFLPPLYALCTRMVTRHELAAAWRFLGEMKRFLQKRIFGGRT